MARDLMGEKKENGKEGCEGRKADQQDCKVGKENYKKKCSRESELQKKYRSRSCMVKTPTAERNQKTGIF